MKNITAGLLTILLLATATEALAVERYVNVSNPSPSAPYLTWATAANNIQSAIDASSFGDVITVTNGIYQTGASVVPFDTGSNRVSITKPLLVRSVNGPGVTIIDGGGTIRCVAVEGNAVLSGFTLTNGYAALTNATGYGGGALGVGSSGPRTLTNCIVAGNAAAFPGGGAARCILNNCVVSNNYSAQTGGGIAYASANNCTIVNNVARFGGGGAVALTMTNCIIIGNSATNGSGGGAIPADNPSVSSFVNCAFINNRATSTNGSGGGFGYRNSYGYATLLYNCTFTNNSAGTGGGAYGGTLYDCVLVGNQATNGVGQGGGAANAGLYRCLVLGNSAKLGGGVYSLYTDNCVIGGNSASVAGGGIYGGGGDAEHHFDVITNNSAYDGGGVASVSDTGVDIFYTCLFSGNWATNRGGAAYENAWLTYCTVAGNSAGNEAGGVYGSAEVERSVIYHNSAPLNPNHDTNYVYINNSCTTPMPANDYSYNNITNDPVFANVAAGNFRLSSNSPCINFSRYSSPPDPNNLDLDGNPGVVGGAIDIGAYEFQTPASSLSYFWLQQYGLPTDGSADHADTDGDHFDNWSEWAAHTSPLDATSLLKVLQVVPNVDSSTVTWQSVSDVGYVVERSTSLTANPSFNYVSYVSGSPDTNVTSFVDTGATGPGPLFYRIRVP